jgi:hypothetical protein
MVRERSGNGVTPWSAVSTTVRVTDVVGGGQTHGEQVGGTTPAQLQGADSLEREGERERVHRRRGDEGKGRLPAIHWKAMGKHHVPPLILVGDAIGLGVLALRQE